MTMPKFEPVIWMGREQRKGYEAQMFSTCKDAFYYTPLYTGDQLTEAYEAGKRDAIPKGVRKDAERYRWLRESGSNWIKCDVDTEISMSQPDNWDWPTTIDTVIDAALAAAPKGEE